MPYHFSREVFHCLQNPVQYVFKKKRSQDITSDTTFTQRPDLYSNSRKY